MGDSSKHGTCKRARVIVEYVCPECNERSTFAEVEINNPFLKKNVTTTECGICGERVILPSLFIKRQGAEDKKRNDEEEDD